MAILLPISFTSMVCAGCAAIAIAGLTPSSPTAGGDIAAAAMTDTPSAAPVQIGRDPIGRWQRAPDGLFYVNATVNGVRVRFLVDTGASVTVLTSEDARRVGAGAIGPATTIATVGGSAPMRWTELEKVALGGKRLGRISAAVVDRPGGVSLLGQNTLRRMKTFSINGDELTLS
ncbi:TIGR02281 family clan AA aspartic protease [Sphingomonas qilianensis]|uniref:Retropepsin-like aspartic protease n=1 Tax=Sphingomonas qilianensis TaxID=1736690 RepID=A0ABU9XR71_9SPHN